MYHKLIIKNHREFLGFSYNGNKSKLEEMFKRVREFKDNEKIFNRNMKLTIIWFTLFYIYSVSFIIGIYISMFYLREIIEPTTLWIIYVVSTTLWIIYSSTCLRTMFDKKYNHIIILSNLYCNDFTTAITRVQPLVTDITNFEWYYIYIWSITADIFSREKTSIIKEVSKIEAKKWKKVTANDVKIPLVYFVLNMDLSFKKPNLKNMIENSEIQPKKIDNDKFKKMMELPVKLCFTYKWSCLLFFITMFIGWFVGLIV